MIRKLKFVEEGSDEYLRGAARNLFVKLADHWDVHVFENTHVEPLLEGGIAQRLWVALKCFGDTENGPHQVQLSLGLRIVFEFGTDL